LGEVIHPMRAIWLTKSARAVSRSCGPSTGGRVPPRCTGAARHRIEAAPYGLRAGVDYVEARFDDPRRELERAIQ